jgi:hypothetical protein
LLTVFFSSVAIKLYWRPAAEDRRRAELISNASSVALTVENTEGYYNNSETDPNWHALLHFAISCGIDAGLASKTVQTFAGHSSLQVTMDRYGHLFRSDDHSRVMDTLARQLECNPANPSIPKGELCGKLGDDGMR